MRVSLHREGSQATGLQVGADFKPPRDLELVGYSAIGANLEWIEIESDALEWPKRVMLPGTGVEYAGATDVDCPVHLPRKLCPAGQIMRIYVVSGATEQASVVLHFVEPGSPDPGNPWEGFSDFFCDMVVAGGALTADTWGGAAAADRTMPGSGQRFALAALAVYGDATVVNFCRITSDKFGDALTPIGRGYTDFGQGRMTPVFDPEMVIESGETYNFESYSSGTPTPTYAALFVAV